MSQGQRIRERRWMVLAQDGRHVWVGRHTDPTEAEIASVEASLTAQSLAGWLTVTEGDYWDAGTSIVVLPVRPLAEPNCQFEVAAASFEQLRAARLADGS